MKEYPKIRCELVLTSYQDLDVGVYDCLNKIQCDRVHFRRAKEVGHSVYGFDKDGQFIIWKGAEYAIINDPFPCFTIEEALEKLYQNVEPYICLINRLRQQYQLQITIIIFILLDNDYNYPEMVVTKKMMQFASSFDAEILINCEVDE